MNRDFQANPAQERAVRELRGPMLLVSCPGSGKTTTLVRRVHELVRSGADPREILMLTFSRDAAREMWRKYEELFGPNPGISFQTIHSLCWHILTEEQLCVRENILSEEEKQAQLLRLALQYVPEEDCAECAAAVGTDISVMKNNAEEPEHYKPLNSDPGTFRVIFSAYETWRRDSRRLDFDDLLTETSRLLSDSKMIRDRWAYRFRHLSCDEYQDINPVQRNILLALTSHTESFCAAGDDDQSIYRFRGSRPEIMLHFQRDYPDARIVMMDTNFRSAEQIITHASALIAHNRERHPKQMQSSRGLAGERGEVRLIKAENRKDEMRLLTEAIEEEHRKGIPHSETAVLYRTNRLAERAAAALDEAGIPYRLQDAGLSLYETWIFLDLRTYYELSAGLCDHRSVGEMQEKVRRILNHPNRFLTKEAFLPAEYTEEAFRDALDYLPQGAEEDGRHERAVGAVNLWMSLFGPGKVTPESSPADFLERLEGPDSLHYDLFLIEAGRTDTAKIAEYQEAFAELKREAGSCRTMGEWMNRADRMIGRLHEMSRRRAEDAVTLSTMHRAKGREWHSVYLIDCNPGIIPYRDSFGNREALEEERRLFYVAMTRARDRLTVFSTSERASIFVREAGLLTAEEQKVRSSVPRYSEGTVVCHAKYGEGRIEKYEGEHVLVLFGEERRRFRWPEAVIGGYLRVEESD